MSPKMICPRCWGTGVYPRDSEEHCSWCHGEKQVDDEQLSASFWLSEMLRSQVAIRNGLDNAPPPVVVANLRNLCTRLLQPLRDAVGPLHVNSGYRSPAVNTALAGSSRTSAHMEGSAADLDPTNVSIKQALQRVLDDGWEFDQLIYEGTWLHAGSNKQGIAVARRQVLMMFGGQYMAYDPSDSRVV
jgi:zinc D-Ala-D-Ala carboxypeptidase